MTTVLFPFEQAETRWDPNTATSGTPLEVSFDSGATWHALTEDTDGWFILVAGPDASGNGAVVLDHGMHSAFVREVGDELSVAYNAVQVIIRAECEPWPVDWGCNPKADEIDPAVKYRAERMAISALRGLTLGQVGNCPITVRPCSIRCNSGLHQPFETLSPYILRGQWYNASCGCGEPTGCGCGRLPTIVLPGPVTTVERVVIDGAEVTPSAYRVDNSNELVRIDGGEWPICQDMATDLTEEGSFGVTYTRGSKVGPVGSYVAGLLATEFAKSCLGGQCALPSGVTSISRQGVTMEIQADVFEGGLTGIREVDAYTARFNPGRLRTRPAVYSPDLPAVRQTTWSAG